MSRYNTPEDETLISHISKTDKLMRNQANSLRATSSSIGKGGLRIQGGHLLAEDLAGDKVFEVTTNPADIFMRQELISALSIAILRDRIVAETIAESFVTSENGFVEAPDGPEVTVDIIGSSALVYVGASIFASGGNANYPDSTGGRMAFNISGATSVGANASDAFATSMGVNIDGGVGVGYAYSNSVRGGSMNLVTGLNPGEHTFAARYASVTDGLNASFQGRTIFVIAF